MTSPLAKRIRDRIVRDGPISVADYMEIALGDPEHGYYATRDPFGRGGDFVTAPEVSQMFGEIVGLWVAHMWTDLSRSDPLVLAELGPGRGTLMADMLRAARIVPGFTEAAHVHLVETSPALRERQRATLRDAPVPVFWHQRFADILSGPAIIVANELFDALPIRQFLRMECGWHERRIAAVSADRLVWTIAESAADIDIIPRELRDARQGSIVEVSAQREALAKEIGARLAQTGGAALIIDYGHAGPAAGDTFQAVKGHAYADPLDDPGEADLTAHVDFSALCEAARAAGARTFGPITQAEFLTELGLGVRADRLKATRPDRAAEIDLALARLSSPEQMGTLFKVAAFTGWHGPPPPPFAAD